MPVLVTCKFVEDPIRIVSYCDKNIFPHYKSMGNIFGVEGRITPQNILSRKLNLSDISSLFSYAASLAKI